MFFELSRVWKFSIISGILAVPRIVVGVKGHCIQKGFFAVLCIAVGVNVRYI